MRTRTVAWMLAAMFVGAVSCFAQDARLINGFNGDADLNLFRWSPGIAHVLVTEHVTEGKGAVKVTFPKDSEYGGFGIDEKLFAGWAEFDEFSFDVFNPGDAIVTLGMRVDDDRTTGGDDYATWFTGTYKVFPGANHVAITLTSLQAPKFGKMHIDRLKSLGVWAGKGKADRDLVFDNFALRKFPRQAALPAGMRGFDFGPPKSPIQPGFVPVDENARYSDERGCGFVGGAQLTSVEDLPRTGEPLACDSVAGSPGVPLTFAVKLPDGRYRLWAATGYVQGWNWPRRGYTVAAAGKEVFRWEPPSLDPRDCRDYLDRDYSRNADLWKMFVVGRLFDEFETDVDVKGGKLEVTVASKDQSPRIRGLAVWPAGDAACAKAMAEVQTSRRDGFARKWREIRPAAAPYAFTPEETARGFMLASRNPLDTITPYFAPKADDRLAKISIAAAPGQYEPAPFIVYPAKDIPGCETSVSDLKGPAGTIAASAVKVHTVQYRYCRDGEDVYSVRPAHLAPRSKLDLEARVPRQFWMNVFVPEDAKPGRYAATVTVSAGGKSASFPLELEVHPFKLDRPSDHGYTYAHACSVPNTPEAIEADLRCLQERGSNSLTPGGAIGWKVAHQDGKLVVDFTKLDLLMEAMRKLGMTGPVPLFDMSVQGEAGGKFYPHLGFLSLFGYKLESQEYLDDVTALTRLVLERAKEKNYLPVIMYPSTEISNDPNVGPAFNAKIIAAMRKAGSVACVSSINQPEDVATAKELEYTMINFGVGINDETLKRIHESGTKLWFQNIGQTRYADGLFLLRCGAVGRRQWVASWPDCDPYSDWDGEDSGSFTFPSPVGTLAKINLEWMHLGVDDLRYFLTMKRLIGEARKAGKAAAADEAQKAFDEMIATCPVGLARGTKILPDGFSVTDGFADKSTFDRYRRRAAEQIVKLMNAMEKR